MKKARNASGFTLIEMLVAVGIFMFVMVIAIGSLIAIVQADRKAQSIEAVVDNLRFALDDMSRTVRTGTDFNCAGDTNSSGGRDCVPGSAEIAVTDQYGSRVAFQFSSSCPGLNGQSTGCILRSVRNRNGQYTDWQPMTSSEVNIQNLTFYVIGAEVGDQAQPKLTILLSAQISQGLPQPTNLHLQTTVVQRIYNLH